MGKYKTQTNNKQNPVKLESEQLRRGRGYAETGGEQESVMGVLI